MIGKFRFAVAAIFLSTALWASGRDCLAEDGLPAGRIGALGGVRYFTARAEEDYHIAPMWGFEGGYQPGNFGLVGTLLFGTFRVVAPEATFTTAFTSQLSLAGRYTQRVSDEAPLYLSAQAGVDFFRATQVVPVEDGKLSHIAPGVGVSAEIDLGPLYVSFAVRYSLIGDSAGGTAAYIVIGSGD